MTRGDDRAWVVDTSVYTHLSRAGHLELLRTMAPGGRIHVVRTVENEAERGSERHVGIKRVDDLDWVERVMLTTDEEKLTALLVKGRLGGHHDQHLGECAAIAYARSHLWRVIMDDRDAGNEARHLGVLLGTTMEIIIKAHVRHAHRYPRERVVQLVDDLLATGMRLPMTSGEQAMVWAYENGHLPDEEPDGDIGVNEALPARDEGAD